MVVLATFQRKVTFYDQSRTQLSQEKEVKGDKYNLNFITSNYANDLMMGLSNIFYGSKVQIKPQKLRTVPQKGTGTLP